MALVNQRVIPVKMWRKVHVRGLDIHGVSHHITLFESLIKTSKILIPHMGANSLQCIF